MKSKLKFRVDELTFGDALKLVEIAEAPRLSSDTLRTLCDLLMRYSDMKRDEIMALRLSDLPALMSTIVEAEDAIAEDAVPPQSTET